MGVVLIVAYAAIASKLMRDVWNISLMWFAVEYPSPLVFRLIKGAVAGPEDSADDAQEKSVVLVHWNAY
jgi:hypothetical protein